MRGLAKLTRRSDTPAVFDQVFYQHLVSPDTLKLHTIQNLQVGLFGIDSSAQADYFARGYVNPKMFPGLETGTRDADPDLVILLTHHHLQPIRNLEERLQNSLRSLSNLTLMVNAGTFLESMTRAHIDLVLHGHEHASHWARYGSLESGKAEVCVIGAGSATGNSAVGGCSLDGASFNAIYVSRDHSVGLKVLNYEKISAGASAFASRPYSTAFVRKITSHFRGPSCRRGTPHYRKTATAPSSQHVAK
jgi:hypothetical protein